MPTHQQLLDFEALHPRHSGWKEEAIRRELGVTPARYYVLLARAVESIDGARHDPITVRQVRQRGRRERAA